MQYQLTWCLITMVIGRNYKLLNILLVYQTSMPQWHQSTGITSLDFPNISHACKVLRQYFHSCQYSVINEQREI